MTTPLCLPHTTYSAPNHASLQHVSVNHRLGSIVLWFPTPAAAAESVDSGSSPSANASPPDGAGRLDGSSLTSACSSTSRISFLRSCSGTGDDNAHRRQRSPRPLSYGGVHVPFSEQRSTLQGTRTPICKLLHSQDHPHSLAINALDSRYKFDLQLSWWQTLCADRGAMSETASHSIRYPTAVWWSGISRSSASRSSSLHCPPTQSPNRIGGSKLSCASRWLGCCMTYASTRKASRPGACAR